MGSTQYFASPTNFSTAVYFTKMRTQVSAVIRYGIFHLILTSQVKLLLFKPLE